MHNTASLCPICLKPIPAVRKKVGKEYRLIKTCPDHGTFSALVWKGSEDLELWTGPQPECGAEPDLNCPQDCGLCGKHLRMTCCTLLEVTDRCNLRCRFCFADNEQATDRPLSDILEDIRDIVKKTGGTLLQLSGGEPTLRDDLPEIVAFAKEAGYPYIQLNTNGLRLAADPGYVKALAQAGLSFVFLQFDGVSDDVYRTLRGRPLLALKEQAIANCAACRIGVTLVPTLVPGVNTHQVGDLVRYAMTHTPAVRGVHFQPVSYFGRIPHQPTDDQRYTLGQLLDDLVEQTGGVISRESLVPSACDHPLCGFHGDYVALPGGRVQPLSKRGAKVPSGCQTDPARQNRDYIGKRWSRTDPEQGPCCCAPAMDPDLENLDEFLRWKRTHGFTLTSMAFQDAGNLDFERLRHCSLHVYRSGKLIPFCASYVTRYES